MENMVLYLDSLFGVSAVYGFAWEGDGVPVLEGFPPLFRDTRLDRINW